MEVRRLGAMRNLVLLHGFLGSALNWGPVLSRLRKKVSGWNFLTPELLGHGQRANEGRELEPSSRAVAEDLLSQIPNEPFVALGHSFGLRPLLSISQIRPKMIEALIVEDASP